MGETRLQLWSCGGGRQSAGIAALILQGELPAPDHACMVRLEWEVRTVWPYVERYIMPALASKGVPFSVIDRKQYATKGFWGGLDGDSILLPCYTDESGRPSKLPEWCSGEWKREVAKRWAATMPGWQSSGVDCWVGISRDESQRRGQVRVKWFAPVYPLLDVRPTRLSGCLAAVEKAGWPEPPRSRCAHCPNQSDAEWMELTPEEFLAACDLEDEIRTVDPHAFLHRSLIPLRQVQLDPKADNGGLFGGCSSGTCY